MKLPLEQYSVLHLFTHTAGNGTEKADKKSQLNVLEKEWIGEFRNQAGTRREISGLELETVYQHILAKLFSVYWSTRGDMAEWHLCSNWF